MRLKPEHDCTLLPSDRICDIDISPVSKLPFSSIDHKPTDRSVMSIQVNCNDKMNAIAKQIHYS